MSRAFLLCYYCARGIGAEDGANTGGMPPENMPASVTFHDARGCLHVCTKHAAWRLKRSFAAGHSSDCPYARGEFGA